MKRRHVIDRATTVEASYIDIPGVPTGVIPPFLNALQVTTKFFQIKKKEQFSIVDWDRLNDNGNNNTALGGGRRRRGRITNIVNNCNNISGNNNNNNNNNKDGIDDVVNVNVNVHDTIMNRMESSSASAISSSSSTTNDELQNKFVQAVQSWIDHVKYLAQREHREPSQNQTLEETTTSSSNNNGLLQAEEQQKKKEKKPIPYSMFLYLWEMQQQHNRVAVRRSALLLSALLLQKSKDCRFYIDQDTCLADWVTNIFAANNLTVVWKNPDRAVRELPLLHREALSLLDHLIHKGYGRIYAKLGVAAKNLKRQCTSLNVSEESDSTTPNSMAIWRKLRDIALLNGEKEIQKVEKLLIRADTCLEILVPRIGGIDDQLPDESRRRTNEDQHKENKSEDHNNVIDDSDDDSDDDSGIDWEDGDDVEKGKLSSAKDEQYSHLSAVEMTISAMEASGTHEELEINFDRRVNEEECEDNTADNIRKKLEMTIQKLASRHLIRLSAWLDGLRNSDSLVLMDSASLVSLSSKSIELRLKLIKRLSVLKEDVTRVLSSASRLNIQVDKRKEQDQAHIGAVATQNPSVSGLLPPQGIGDAGGRIRFETSRKRKQKSRQCRPRIIQINRKK